MILLWKKRKVFWGTEQGEGNVLTDPVLCGVENWMKNHKTWVQVPVKKLTWRFLELNPIQLSSATAASCVGVGEVHWGHLIWNICSLRLGFNCFNCPPEASESWDLAVPILAGTAARRKRNLKCINLKSRFCPAPAPVWIRVSYYFYLPCKGHCDLRPKSETDHSVPLTLLKSALQRYA